ncbi:MAG: tyrosine-type recombinase/integrase [Hungatella sp.]|nr:tyrosine-type recombinase/integrase [Hungatella sp.]MCI9503270.1 tyrosine-type recombinase/integrase [Hungatella sp.]
MHSLRHTFASRMLTSGVDISIVSKLLGHSDINITYKKYIHILHGQLEAFQTG